MPGRQYIIKRGKKSKKKLKRRMRRYRSIPLNGFPTKYTTRMKCTHFITLNMSPEGSATGLNNYFRANSAFDPDASGVSGHQPRGYDQLSAIYDHYTVIGSKLTASFDPQVDNFSNVSMYCYARLIDGMRGMPTLVDMCEDKFGKTKLLPAAGRIGTKGQPQIRLRYSPYKFHGVSRKDSIVNNPNFRATVFDNPEEDAFYEVGIICAESTSTDPAPVVCRVDIEYIVVFTEPKPITAS